MATNSENSEGAAAPAKSKKTLVMVLLALLVLALVVGGGWIYLIKKQQAAALDDEEEVAAVETQENQGPPTYLPLENMVVNLADPGGDRVAQVGVTLELDGVLVVERVKSYLPSIRSQVLMLISQRTAEELLSREGKEKLAADIKTASSKHFEAPGAKGKKNAKPQDNTNPIKGVLFSSFIVQ